MLATPMILAALLMGAPAEAPFQIAVISTGGGNVQEESVKKDEAPPSKTSAPRSRSARPAPPPAPAPAMPMDDLMIEEAKSATEATPALDPEATPAAAPKPPVKKKQ